MTKRTTTRSAGRWARAALVLGAGLIVALATALPADAQASRTRPDEGTTAGSGSSGRTAVSGSTRSSGSSTRSRTSGSPGRAARTRPPSGSSGGRVAIPNDRRPSGHRYDRYHRPYRHPYYYPWSSPYYRFSWSLGYWGWYGWWDWSPYGYGYPAPYYYPPARYYPSRVRDNMGALDLDLKPGDTQIYLNGQLIGSADRFDGWPQYLWLEEGDYHFVFYREGRRTIAREYTVYPGVVIDVEDRLERGEPTPPEELFPPPTERRDARLRREAEQRARAEAEAGDWRRRSEVIRERTEGEDWEESPADADAPESRGEAAEGFASVRLAVEPADASVYLDGRFLGTAGDLVRLRRGLTVDPGEHRLSVVRPGHRQEEVEFTVEAGEAVDLAVTLQPLAGRSDG